MTGSILRVDCHTPAYTNVPKPDISVPIHMFQRQTFFPPVLSICHARIDITPTLILNAMRVVLPQSGNTWDQVPSQIYPTIPTIFFFLIIKIFTFTLKCKRSGVVIGMESGIGVTSSNFDWVRLCSLLRDILVEGKDSLFLSSLWDK